MPYRVRQRLRHRSVRPGTTPAFRNTTEFARAWFLGDLALQAADRVYQVTYEQTFKDAAEYAAEFGSDPLSERYVNEAVTGWNDTNVRNDADLRPGGAAHGAAASRTLAILTTAKGSAEVAVDLVRPELRVEKTCTALPGRDDPATTSSFGAETTGSIPNFRCILTATNSTNALLGTSIVDPVFVDTMPVATVSPANPMTTQLISATPGDPALTWTPTTVVGSLLSPPALSSVRFEAPGLTLAPGESVSVELLVRLSGSTQFWAGATTSERARNRVTATSFSDTLGNAYAGNSTATWDILIQKPAVAISHGTWVGDDYAAQLADGQPTACLAYGSAFNCSHFRGAA